MKKLSTLLLTLLLCSCAAPISIGSNTVADPTVKTQLKDNSNV